MRIFGLEIRKTSGLANPQEWLTELLGGDITESGIAVTSDTAMRLSAVWACVKVLSESVAMLPLILYRRDGESKSRAADHRLYPILHDQPNPEMTAYTFKQTMMVNLLLRGNAYAEIEFDRIGRVIRLWPLPYDAYSITPYREAGEIVYKVRNLILGGEVTIPSWKMLHIMGLGRNGYIGLSPIQQAQQGIGLGLAAEQFGAKFFGSGANMSGVLEHPQKLSTEATAKLKKSWDNAYGGLSKAHKTVVLEEGMKYARIGIPPNDAQFLETRKFQVTDIARIYRVPPHMVGDLDRATWANIEHQAIEFVVHSLGPWLKNWEQTINWKLLDERERKEYYSEFLVDALLRGDIKTRYQSYAIGKAHGWLSSNDIRRYENMDPIDGGDMYLVPMNMVPADQAGQKTNNTQGSAPPDTPVRSIPIKVSATEERKRLSETFIPLISDALDRVYKRERADIMRQARKKNTDSDTLIGWIESYYDGEHPAFVKRTLLPAIQGLADAIGRTIEIDIAGWEWRGLDGDTKEYLDRYAESVGKRESIASRDQVIETIRSATAQGSDIAESLNAMFDDWDSSRLETDTAAEAESCADAVVKYGLLHR
jgi:HK97 family phage portal protein